METIHTVGIPVEVYLSSSIVRGRVFTKHQRLSDYLNVSTDDRTISVDDGEIQTLERRGAVVKSQSVLIRKRQVLFVVDLSSSSSTTKEELGLLWANREPQNVFIEVDSFWLEGQVHLVPNSKLDRFAEGKSSFIPLTGATILNRQPTEPRTFLINRDKVNFLLPRNGALRATLPRAMQGLG